MKSSTGNTILLVEDEAIIAIAEAQTLEGFGFSVVIALSGEEAVDTATGDEHIDLVLMDIDLGRGIDGAEAAKRILLSRDMPIVFLTSHSERAMVDKIQDVTRYGLIIKGTGDFVLLSGIKMAFDLFEKQKNTEN